MEIASGTRLDALRQPRVRQALLVVLLAITTALSMRAELFLIVITAFTGAVALALTSRERWQHWRSIDRHILAVSAMLAALWAYGVLRGLYEGHPTGHVIRNFFGLVVFLPALLSVALMTERRGISRLVGGIGAGVLALLLALRTASVFNVVPFAAYQWLGVPVGLSEFGFRLYSFGAFPIFGWEALVAFAVHRALDRGEWTRAARRAALLLVIVSGTSFVTESKGILLGTMAVLGIPVILVRHWRSGLLYAVVAGGLLAVHVQVLGPAATFVATDVLGLQRSEEMLSVVESARLRAEAAGTARGGSGLLSAGDAGTNPLDVIFGAQRPGNFERYAQAGELLADVVLVGHGLGAPITSGYNRSVTFPYGFELSYLNVVHKFGVFSVLYFWFLAYSGYRILTADRPAMERCTALGLLGYAFPAIGNPILFAVPAVYLHMLALHGVTRRRARAASLIRPPTQTTARTG